MGVAKCSVGSCLMAVSALFFLGSTTASALSAKLSGPQAGCDTFELKVTFDEAVPNFNGQNLLLVNALAGKVWGGPLEYIVPISTTGALALIEIPQNSVFNDAFEGNIQTEVFEYETLPWIRGTQTGAFDLKITFSEPVSGLAAEDFVISAGDIAQLSGGPVKFLLSVVPPLESAGTLQVNLPAGAAADECGNLSMPSPERCIPFDTTIGDTPKANHLSESAFGQSVNSLNTVPILGMPGLAALAALLGLAGARGARRTR